MNWINIKKKSPSHKDLVLCKGKDGAVLPAIYYYNSSFDGFYPFTTFYHYMKPYGKPDDNYHIYSEVRSNKINGVVEWMPMPE